jgi:hypothetical protein
MATEKIDVHSAKSRGDEFGMDLLLILLKDKGKKKATFQWPVEKIKFIKSNYQLQQIPSF